MNLRKTKFDYFEIHTLDNDGAVNKSIAQGELWEPHIINFLKCNSNKSGDFVDVGSNFGWHSLIASKFFSNFNRTQMCSDKFLYKFVMIPPYPDNSGCI